MTIQELITNLQEFPPEMEVLGVYSKNQCTGHSDGEYCYCGYSDEKSGLSIEREMIFNKKTKKQELTKVYIRV